MQINILNKYANFRKLCKFLDITIYDKTMLYKKVYNFSINKISTL